MSRNLGSLQCLTMAQAKRKKKFFDVEISLINKETQLQAYELKELDGKFIEYDLTRILRGKSMLLQSKVMVKGEKAIATPTKIKLMPYYKNLLKNIKKSQL